VRRVLRSHSATFHKQLIDLKGTVLDLLFRFLRLGQDGSGLRSGVYVGSFEEGLRILIALVDDSVHVHEGGVLFELPQEGL
jgi:hypothetical protein